MRYLGTVTSNNTVQNEITLSTRDITSVLKPNTYADYKHLKLISQYDCDLADADKGGLVIGKDSDNTLLPTDVTLVATLTSNTSDVSNIIIDTSLKQLNVLAVQNLCTIEIDLKINDSYNLVDFTIAFKILPTRVNFNDSGDTITGVNSDITTNTNSQYSFENDLSLANRIINTFNNNTGIIQIEVNTENVVPYEFWQQFTEWHLFADKT